MPGAKNLRTASTQNPRSHSLEPMLSLRQRIPLPISHRVRSRSCVNRTRSKSAGTGTQPRGWSLVGAVRPSLSVALPRWRGFHRSLKCVLRGLFVFVDDSMHRSRTSWWRSRAWVPWASGPLSI